jgi:hypothetical protein
MRSTAVLMVVMIASACSRDSASDGNQMARTALVPDDLSGLELKARDLYDATSRRDAQARKLRALVGKAMATAQPDSFSTHYAKLRFGRGGAVCGQFNARDQVGGYAGFKDFVLLPNHATVVESTFGNGISVDMFSPFAKAYAEHCATAKEARMYNLLKNAPASTDLPPSGDASGMNTL